MSPVTDLELLRCPATGGRLRRGQDGDLIAEDGRRTYPVVAEVPILIDEDHSPFRLADYRRPSEGDRPRRLRRVVQRVDASLPALSHNVGSAENYRRLAELLRDKQLARVLVVGGAVAGVGFETLLSAPNLELVETDVAWGPRTAIICDVHSLPFPNGSFDAVVCQAVLEHVLDPVAAVNEIHRVLVDDGLVYSEVPFLYPVHGAPYDFTRFTPLGHRLLFRRFDEIQWGMQSGPGSMLALSLTYFVRSLAATPVGAGLAMRAGRLIFSWLRHLDRWLAARPAAVDASAGTNFLGRRRSEPMPAEQIVASHPRWDTYRAASPAGVRSETLIRQP
jgi:SAM-dependent methyltransferase